MVETFPQSRLTFRLGCPVILELPSAERLKGFVAGVEGLRACCCRLMLIVVRDGDLEVMYLSTLPKPLSRNAFSSLISWSDGPRWASIPLCRLRRMCEDLILPPANSSSSWRKFAHQWLPLLRRHQERCLQPKDLLTAANALMGFQGVRL